jgi:small conductance mechanosensitive channel
MTDTTNPANVPTEDTAPHLPQIDLETIKNIDAAEVTTAITQFNAHLLELATTWGIRTIIAIIILTIAWTVGSWLQQKFTKARHMDATLKDFLGRLVKYSVITVAVVTVVGLLGIPMASLLAVLGAAGLAIGLALQGTLSNIAAGVMLLILRPFNVGDYITWGNEGGTVKTLGLFGTELAMADNVYIFAPNSKIWGNEIRNFSRNPMRRQDINVSISYDDDLNKALSILNSIVATEERILKTPDDKMPQILTDRMSEYRLEVIVRFWSSNADYWNLRWHLTKQIKEELEAAGISLALTQRQLTIGENIKII